MSSLPPLAARRDVVRVVIELAVAVVAGVLAYGLSCLILAPAVWPQGFGEQWYLMSGDPFALRGQFPQRILAPLLSWLCGVEYIAFTRGLAMCLLATVFFCCRRRGAAMIDAALVTVAIALTAAVQMYKIHWVGYPDALCYTLFFWSLLCAKRTVVFWLLFAANLFNHELAVFLLPWLWFLRRETNGRVRDDVIGAGASLAAYGAFYLFVRAAAEQQKYNADYFASYPMFPGGTVVILLMAITHWTVAYGPLLAVLGWHQRAPKNGRERWHLWLVLGGIVAIFCIAWDWSRHSNLIVLPFVIASVRFLAAGHRALYAAIVAAGAALMWWWPPWPATAQPTHSMTNADLLLGSGAATLHPVTNEPVGGSLGAVLTSWLPTVAPTLAPIVAIFAAICFAGWWFARWEERRVVPRD